MYKLMQDTYATPTLSTVVSSRNDRRANQEHVKKVEWLWFLLAQATKGSASLVVQRYKRSGQIVLAAIKTLENREPIEITDATVLSKMECSVCKECKPQVSLDRRGRRRP